MSILQSKPIISRDFEGNLYDPIDGICNFHTNSIYGGIEDPKYNGKCVDTFQKQVPFSTDCNISKLSNNGKHCMPARGDGEKDDYPHCFQPAVGSFWTGKGYEKICEYDLDLFDSVAQGREYMNKFGRTGENVDRIMSQVCGMITQKDCPINPDTGERMKECMVLRSENRDGDTCQDWAIRADPLLIDRMKTRWCTVNRNAEDCKCINRAFDPEYKDLKRYFQQNDSCWYAPCSNTGAYLTHSTKEDCTANICQVVYQLKNNNDVIIKNVKNAIQCYGYSDPNIPGPSTGPVVPQDPVIKKGTMPFRPIPPGKPKTFVNFLNENWQVLSIVIGGFLIFFLIFYKLK